MPQDAAVVAGGASPEACFGICNPLFAFCSLWIFQQTQILRDILYNQEILDKEE